MTARLDQLLERTRGGAAKLIFLADDGAQTSRTFAELHDDATRLAADLQRAGVTTGSRIGILAPNAYEWMVWDLAALAAGSILVAFPQNAPHEPVEQLVERYALCLMVIDASFAGSQLLGAPHIVAIEDVQLPADKRARRCSPPAVPAGTHSLVFSSGTTGKTKGLIISGRGTQHLLTLYAEAFGVAADERFLSFLPFANYQQRMAYYFCLHHGIDFVYVPFALLFASLKKYRPTYTIAPPILYESLQNLAQGLMAATGGTAGSVLKEILGGNIRYLVTGMAPIKKRTLEFFWDNGLQLFEAFGITEAGMVTWNKPGKVKLGSVGQPAEPGSVSLTADGEVVVTRSALLSLGYFEASEEDQRNTFIAHDAVATGDIASFDEAGFLTIIGRKKDAIITRSGEKFHPEPIETLLQRDPRIRVAVVTECERMTGTVAILSLHSAADAAARNDIQAQVARLNEQLPTYQQVKQCIFTEEDFSIENGLRTRNMKLNRKAIRARFIAAPGAMSAALTSA